MVIRDGKAVVDDNSNNYVWTACKPTPLSFDRSEFVSGSGVNAIYQYYFHVSLDNSQANATGANSGSIYFPHVGASKTTIYENVSNDATYEVVKIENGIVYFRVKTANVASSGCPLKFNLSLLVSGAHIFFSANGQFTQNSSIDDGSNNMYFINFNNGSVSKAF